MDHLTLKAVVTTTDQGVFKAVISTESVDREKDVVSADGMVAALRKWNRPIPLAWNHGTKADDIFGAVDPETADNIDGEVVVDGKVDLESTTGPDAWRSFKNRTIGFSFGYLILAETKRAGGGRNITALDVFEITATPTPMNNDTRVLSTKAAEADLAEAEVQPEPDLAKELQEVKARLDTLEKALEDQKSKTEVTDKEPRARSVDPLRKHAREAAQDILRGGVGVKPPQDTEEPRAPEMNPAELREYSRAQIVQILSGGIAS